MIEKKTRKIMLLFILVSVLFILGLANAAINDNVSFFSDSSSNRNSGQLAAFVNGKNIFLDEYGKGYPEFLFFIVKKYDKGDEG